MRAKISTQIGNLLQCFLLNVLFFFILLLCFVLRQTKKNGWQKTREKWIKIMIWNFIDTGNGPVTTMFFVYYDFRVVHRCQISFWKWSFVVYKSFAFESRRAEKKLEAEKSMRRRFWMLVREIKDKPKAKIDNISQSTSKITGWEKVYTHPLLALPRLSGSFFLRIFARRGWLRRKRRKILYCRSLMSARKNSTCSHYKLYRLI